MSHSIPSPTPPKSIPLFAAHVLVLALLLGYWPSAHDLYPGLFRVQAGLLFGGGDPPALVMLPATGTARAESDTFVEAFDPESEEPLWRLVISTLSLGYWPSAVLLALLLATPMPPRRRLFAVGLGLLWIHAFAVGRLGLEILRAFAEIGQEAVVEPTGRLLVYRTLSEVLNSNIVVIAAVFLGWVAVASPRQALRMGSLARLLGSPGSGRPRVP